MRRLGCVRAAILLAQDFLFGLFAAILSYSAEDLPYYSSRGSIALAFALASLGLPLPFPPSHGSIVLRWPFGVLLPLGKFSFPPAAALHPFKCFGRLESIGVFLSSALLLSLLWIIWGFSWPFVDDFRHLFLRAFSLLLFLAIAFFGCLFLVADDVTWHSMLFRNHRFYFWNYDVIPDIGQLVPTCQGDLHSSTLITSRLTHAHPCHVMLIG